MAVNKFVLHKERISSVAPVEQRLASSTSSRSIIKMSDLLEHMLTLVKRQQFNRLVENRPESHVERMDRRMLETLRAHNNSDPHSVERRDLPRIPSSPASPQSECE
jgi:hypothetical protein